jgi:hypothetical protein
MASQTQSDSIKPTNQTPSTTPAPNQLPTTLFEDFMEKYKNDPEMNQTETQEIFQNTVATCITNLLENLHNYDDAKRIEIATCLAKVGLEYSKHDPSSFENHSLTFLTMIDTILPKPVIKKNDFFLINTKLIDQKIVLPASF